MAVGRYRGAARSRSKPREREGPTEGERERDRKREPRGQDDRRGERKTKTRRRIWAVLGGAGLSNRLRKCNAEFYNVRDIHALARARGRVRRLAPASQVAAPVSDPGIAVPLRGNRYPPHRRALACVRLRAFACVRTRDDSRLEIRVTEMCDLTSSYRISGFLEDVARRAHDAPRSFRSL